MQYFLYSCTSVRTAVKPRATCLRAAPRSPPHDKPSTSRQVMGRGRRRSPDPPTAGLLGPGSFGARGHAWCPRPPCGTCQVSHAKYWTSGLSHTPPPESYSQDWSAACRRLGAAPWQLAAPHLLAAPQLHGRSLFAIHPQPHDRAETMDWGRSGIRP